MYGVAPWYKNHVFSWDIVSKTSIMVDLGLFDLKPVFLFSPECVFGSTFPDYMFQNYFDWVNGLKVVCSRLKCCRSGLHLGH